MDEMNEIISDQMKELQNVENSLTDLVDDCMENLKAKTRSNANYQTPLLFRLGH